MGVPVFWVTGEVAIVPTPRLLTPTVTGLNEPRVRGPQVP